MKINKYILNIIALISCNVFAGFQPCQQNIYVHSISVNAFGVHDNVTFSWSKSAINDGSNTEDYISVPSTDSKVPAMIDTATGLTLFNIVLTSLATGLAVDTYSSTGDCHMKVDNIVLKN